MKHFLNLDAAQYAAVQKNNLFLLVKGKRQVSAGDELIIENKTDAEAKQIVVIAHDVLTEPGLMKGWKIVTIKQP